MKQATTRRTTSAERGRSTPQSAPFFTPAVQAKLTVSHRGEKLEREADAAADAVLHDRGPLTRGGPISRRMTPIAQRVAEETDAQADCERASDPTWEEHEPALATRPGVVEDEPLQMRQETTEKAEEPDTGTVQRAEEEAQERDESAQPQEEEALARREPFQAKDDEEAAQSREEDTQSRTDDETTQSREDETAPPEATDAPEQAQRRADSPGDDRHVQARAAGPALSPRATRLARVERQIGASRGGGNSLPERVRSKMEQGLSADFSGVRIHTDHPAFMMTRMLNAKAFTSGRDIYFSPHRFAPGTKDGDHLLAHELAHTLQQAAVPVREDAVAQPKAEQPTPPALQAVAEEEQGDVRPESLRALAIARSHIGHINAQLVGPDGSRIGWKRLKEVFRIALGGEVIHELLIKKPIAHPNDLPHWCGIFAWHALRKAGFPLPPWKPGTRMLNDTAARPAGELPQPGDIAYRDKLPSMPDSAPLTNHQALVSGVEAQETAKNKPFAAIKVRTIDGNAAGSNNLGGQVEEKWHPIGDWRHFFDPAGNVEMPDVPRVRLSSADVELGESEDMPVAETPVPDSVPDPAPTDLAALEGDVAAAPDMPAAGLTQVPVNLDLPPPVDVTVEPAAKVRKLELEGNSDEAASAFTKADPSAMAATAPGLGQELNTKAWSERKKAADETPELTARTGGAIDPETVAPENIPLPEDAARDVEGQGPETGAASPDPYLETGTTPEVTATRAGRELSQQAEGTGFFNWLRDQFRSLLNAIKTTDGSVNTSAGPKKRVALTGDADPGRMANQRREDAARLRTQRDARVNSFRTHPGQRNIQPRRVDKGFKSEQAKEPAESIEAVETTEEVADYANAEWPADFRKAADARMGTQLDASMSKVRADIETAGATRDAEKDAAEAEAERKTAEANVAADEAQRKAVIAGRGDVVRQQGVAVKSAYDDTVKFAKDAAGEQTTKSKAIATAVQGGERKSDDQLEKGETEAKDIKRTEEHKATAEKASLENKEGDKGFWSSLNPKRIISKIVKGIDDIFTAMRKAIKEKIEHYKNEAIKFINAARNATIAALDGFRDWSKTQVDTYVKDRYPNLAKALNDGIDRTVDGAIDGVNAAADGAIDAVEKLAVALASAIDGLLARFQAALKLAVGAIGAALTGDFKGALRLAFEAACELAGVDAKPILDFLDRAGNQIMAILKKPGPFINNLFKAVGQGLRNFTAKFVQHFQTGVISWLTGALSAVPITLPEKWDLKGFFSLVAQILGLTYENIKARIIRKFPKARGLFDKIEAGWKFVKMLLDRDYAGLWAEVQARLASLRDTVIDAIRSWTLLTVIKEGVFWLLSLMNPASAIVRLLKMLADLVLWLIKHFQQIKAFVLSVYGAITHIAAGVLKPAADAVEQALARALPVVISFIASALGLGDIAGGIQKAIKKVQEPVNKAIDWLIDKVVAFAKKIWDGIKSGARKAKKKVKAAAATVVTWWKEKRSFKTKDGGSHRIYYRGTGKSAALWVASADQAFKDFLQAELQAKDEDQKKLAGKADVIYREKVLVSEAKIKKLREQRDNLKSADPDYAKMTNQINVAIRGFRSNLMELSDVLKQMTFTDPAAALTKVIYKDGGAQATGQKQVTAEPLTFLPGDEKGSAPSEDPLGYDYARRINIFEKKMVWVRGHMLNDNVHGPGKAKNLIPIPQTVNRTMESKVERDLKSRVHGKREQLWFRATATFHEAAKPETAGFPDKIELEWQRVTPDGKAWKKADELKKVPFGPLPKPPDSIAASVPGIATGSPGALVGAINGPGEGPVTSHFVGLLKTRGPYSVVEDIRTKLTYGDSVYERLDAARKENRDAQIAATIKAVRAGEVELT